MKEFLEKINKLFHRITFNVFKIKIIVASLSLFALLKNVRLVKMRGGAAVTVANAKTTKIFENFKLAFKPQINFFKGIIMINVILIEFRSYLQGVIKNEKNKNVFNDQHKIYFFSFILFRTPTAVRKSIVFGTNFRPPQKHHFYPFSRS